MGQSGVAGFNFYGGSLAPTLYFYNAGTAPIQCSIHWSKRGPSSYEIAGKDISVSRVEFATIATVLVG